MSKKDKLVEFDLDTGIVYKTTLNKSQELRKPWTPKNPKHILSAMPGSVVKTNIKVGSKVKKGDCLMIFKAMKMNNRILAPMDGKIKSVDVEIGENMPKGKIMIEFE